jgi:hypothetical protein
MQKPNFSLVVAVLLAVSVGQIAAACACIMQPGHAPTSVHETHKGYEHNGQDVPDHCVDPCVVTASAELSSQTKAVANAIAFGNDLSALARASEAFSFERCRLDRGRVVDDPPPIIPDTLVRLHTLLLT